MLRGVCNFYSLLPAAAGILHRVSGEYFVYMVASNKNEALYIGVTNDLPRRVWEHRQGEVPGFTTKYHCSRLVYFESCGDVRSAIEREKQFKRWRREKKDKLVATMNPNWDDLAADWF